MKHTKTGKKEAVSAPLKLTYALGSGLVGGIITLCISSCLAALSVKRSSLEGEKVFILALVCAVFSAFITGFITAKMMKHKGILYGFISSLLLAVLLILISLLLTDFKFSYHAIVILLTMILSGTAGGILAVNILK